MKKIARPPESQGLRFVWLELTSRCNLRCIHCYAESGPQPLTRDLLTAKEYFSFISSASILGCRQLQFIGGESTIVPELPDLIVHARASGYEFVEVFTNATRITNQLITCFIENNVAVATSFYSDKNELHDAITRTPGSHQRTANTIKRLVDAGLSVRAGIILMKENSDCVEKTIAYLNSLGVRNVGIDRVRFIGRGRSLAADSHTSAAIMELCGSCWRGSVCIFPDGKVAPCIMARYWPIGSVLQQELDELVQSQALRDIRRRIYQEVWLPRLQNNEKRYGLIHSNPNCGPDCNPNCSPNCVPTCAPQCSPSWSPCYPHGKCNPHLFCGPCGPEAVDNVPQSNQLMYNYAQA